MRFQTKINLFQRVLVISTLCFLISPKFINAQDSLRKRNYHVIGFGTQFLSNIANVYGHDRNIITYNQPALSLFYRYFFSHTPGKSVTTANAHFTYRNAEGYSESGGMGGSSSYKGKFELVRFDIGLSRLATLGKRKGFNVGGGFGLGGLIYSRGEMRESWFSQGVSGSSVVSISKADLLNKINASINFEMNQRFKVNHRSFVILGSKFQIETPEGFSARIGLMETIFLAYTL